jgi:hypothetical protein
MTPRSKPTTDTRRPPHTPPGAGAGTLKAALQFVAMWAFALTISCAFWGLFVVLPVWWVNR